MFFHYFVFISPWKNAGPFIWINLNSLHAMIFCDKLGWNWFTGSGEVFKILSMYFSVCHNIIPLEKAMALLLNNLESRSPKDALCQIWLKMVLEKMKMWKVYGHTTGHTDDRQSEKLLWAFSSDELKMCNKCNAIDELLQVTFLRLNVNK